MANALNKVNSGGIEDGSIVNADIKSDAAIAGSKLVAATTSVPGSMSAADKTKLDGVATSATANPSAPALTGSTNNTICTVTGANAIQGEANLTYDGSTLGITKGDSGTLDAVKITNSDTTNNGLVVGVNSSEEAFLWNGSNTSMNFATNNAERLRIDSSGRLLAGTTTAGDSGADDLTIATSGGTGITIRSGDTSNGSIYFSDGTSGAPQYAGYIQYAHGSTNKMYFGAGSATRFQVESNGNVNVLDGDLVIGTNGHGIDFSASESSHSTSSSVLADYEEGTWTVADGSGAGISLTIESGVRYTKIGRLVHVEVDVTVASNSNSTQVRLTHPFAGTNYSGGVVNYTDYNATLVVHASGSGNGMYVFKGVDSSSAFSWSELSNKRIIFALTYTAS